MHSKCLVLEDSVIRGDLAIIQIGKKVIIQKNVTIKPPSKRYLNGDIHYMHVTIGDNVVIGEGIY